MMERAYENMNIENMDGEKWVNLGCLGYPKYEVSNYGRIKSLSSNNGKDTIRKQTLKNGYLYIGLSNNETKTRKTYVLHRLVAQIFLGENKNTVQHLDGDKMNNRLDNLTYSKKNTK